MTLYAVYAVYGLHDFVQVCVTLCDLFDLYVCMYVCMYGWMYACVFCLDIVWLTHQIRNHGLPFVVGTRANVFVHKYP